MTNNKITFTLFADRAEDAPVQTSGCGFTDGNRDSLGPFMRDLLNELVRLGQLGHYWGFAEYQDEHNGRSIMDNGAVTLEYRAAKAPAVRAALQAMDLAFYELEAVYQRGQKVTPTSVFAIPTTMGIDRSTDYTRVASILATQIDQYGLITGSLTNTFLFQPCAFQQFSPGHLLDVTSFKRQTKHFNASGASRYYKAKASAANPAPVQPASKPSQVMKRRPRAGHGAQAQLDPAVWTFDPQQGH